LAFDTPVRTYLAYADVPPGATPALTDVSTLARWAQASDVTAVRALAFTPGDVLDAAAITRFLPATARSTEVIDVAAPPYSAALAPADATLAIQRALTDAGTRASPAHPLDVVLAPGTYRYHAVLEVPANVRLRGDHTTLEATDPAASALHLAGSRSGALFLHVSVHATERLRTPDSCGIWVGPRTASGVPVYDTLVVGNEISGPAGGHVFGMAEIGGLWAFNAAHDGFADAFHHTGASHDCQVVGNRAAGAPGRGDDLYAFVGYAKQGDPVHHCSCLANYGRDGAARGLAAVGAGFIAFEDNVIQRTQAAGIYVARERPYGTYGSFSVLVRGNRIENANRDATHDGLLAYADEPDATAPSKSFGEIPNRVRDLEVRDNTIIDTSPGRGGGFGIQVRSSCRGGEVVGNVIDRSARSAGLDIAGEQYSTAANTVTASP
jgi:hypothetical protein